MSLFVFLSDVIFVRLSSKVSKYETSQGLFHSLSGFYLHLFSLWEPMTHSCHLQTGNINSTSGPIYPRWLWPKVAALQVLRQVILFGWSCASWWSQRKASPSVLRDSESSRTSHVTASDLHSSSKDNQPCPWVCQPERSCVLYQVEVVLGVGHCSLGQPGKHFLLLELAHRTQPRCLKR